MHGRIAILLGCLLVGGAAARSDDPRVPTLDELLGLESDAGADDRRDALDRALSAEEAGDQFRQAVALMGDAAGRIDGRDLGLQTQRIQEDVLRRLDQVIEASQRQGGGGSSSSSSSSGQGQQQPSQSTQRQAGAASEAESEAMGPELTGTQLAPGVEPDGVTWGHLPARDREAVSQGVSDRYSALYRRLTEMYYRRLAEQEGER